ncbi:MAG: redox-active disulfide protein 2 [Acidobacteria bacterium]|jgi:small redox-active disulfide protein 2|nr:redox-active disulfide protein 2 [Acidobacteriota bacterium]
MSETKRIEVLGPGCARCQETYRVVRHVVESAGLSCEVVKNESIDRMVELGLLATPGVAFDGKVVIFGHIPKADEVRQALGLG